MAANQTFPNAGKVVSSPPQLTCVPAHLVQAFPPQGSKPTVDNVIAVSGAVDYAACYTRFSDDPTLIAEYANALVYQSSVLQSACGTGHIAQLDLIQQSIDNFKTEMNARFDNFNTEMNARFDSVKTEMNARFDLLEAHRAAARAKSVNKYLRDEYMEVSDEITPFEEIPKYIQAVGQGLPNLPAGIPAPTIGTSLPVCDDKPMPDFHLPACSANILTLHQIRLIEAWYGEDFRLGYCPTNISANHRLHAWMVGRPLI